MGIRDWSSDVCSSDLAATESLGRALARLLRLGDVIALSGDLGAGKTALARALIRALPGPQGAADEEVPSPTFTLAQIYERRPGPVWHFDLYRLESAAEVEELGFSEALAGIALVEWPERLGALLPADALHGRSEEHTSELQSLMRLSYAVFCL